MNASIMKISRACQIFIFTVMISFVWMRESATLD
jgi:hypothetical protein